MPQYLSDIKTLPNLLIALLIFFGFSLLDKKNSKLINKIGKYSFSAYLFHQVPVWYPFLWNVIFDASKFKKSDFSFVYVIVVALLTYLYACIVEIIRTKTIDKLIINSKIYRKLENRINKLYE